MKSCIYKLFRFRKFLKSIDYNNWGTRPPSPLPGDGTGLQGYKIQDLAVSYVTV